MWARRALQFSILNPQFSVLLILLLALALRLLLWSQPLHQLANDEVEYVTVARDLLAGRGWQFYEHYHWLRAPLYPLFLAGSLWLAGRDPTAAATLHRAALPNIALSVATVYLCYRLALELVGRKAALLAALLTAILWTLATFASLYMSETLFTFLFTAGLLCLAGRRAQGTGRSRSIPWPAIGAGLFFGLATLTRSVTLMFLPAVALWLLLGRTADDKRHSASTKNQEPRTKEWTPVLGRVPSGWFSVLIWSVGRWSAPVVFILAAALVIAPWTIRNYRAYGRAILVETGLSYNLWAFNEPREDRETIFRTLETIPNPAERSDVAMAKGLARLQEDPAILARKLWPNWIYLWRVKVIEDRFIQESYYADVGLPLFVAALVFDDVLGLLIVLAGMAGLVVYRSRMASQPAQGQALQRLLAHTQQPKALMGAWLCYAVATTLLTHAEMRYRHFLFPVLIPYAAWLLSHAWRWRHPAMKSAESGGGVTSAARAPLANREQVIIIALLSALVGAVWLIYYPREWAAQNLSRGWHALAAQVAWAARQPDAALREDERAIAAYETPDGWLRLGDHARAMGDTQRALKAYRAAVALTPPYVAAVARLGDTLRAAGDEAAARRAFVGDYVDQQRLVDWSWCELRPDPRSRLDVGDGLDFGYVGGVFPAEEEQGASARRTSSRAFLWLRGDALGGRGPATLRLRLAAPRPDSAPARVEVCAIARCQSLIVGTVWRTYLLPLDITSARPLLVEIRSDTFVAPDGRLLGILIDWAEVRGR